MKTTLICDRPLAPNVPLRICERDESGGLVGFWTGYWHPNARLVRLYPAANPYCVWRVSRKPRNVYDGYVIVSKKTRDQPSKKAEVKSSTAKAMKDLVGQIKINI